MLSKTGHWASLEMALEDYIVLGLSQGLGLLELGMQLNIQSGRLYGLVLGHQIAPA